MSQCGSDQRSSEVFFGQAKAHEMLSTSPTESLHVEYWKRLPNIPSLSEILNSPPLDMN